MGVSAKDSRIYYIAIDCPIDMTGALPSEDTPLAFSEEVTRIELTPSVYQRKYGSDKSYGGNHVVSGIKSWDGSITAKVAGDTSYPFSFTAGDLMFIRVFPLGPGCSGPIQGYASVDSDPVVMNLENGEPVEHNYRFSSIGMWRGVLGRNTPSRYACGCSNAGSYSSGFGPMVAGSEAEPAVQPAGLPAHEPITAYQWNGAAWFPAYDECRAGFAPGQAPDPEKQPGKFVGELVMVPCVPV